MSLTFDPKEGLIVVPTRLWGPPGDTLVRLALDTAFKHQDIVSSYIRGKSHG